MEWWSPPPSRSAEPCSGRRARKWRWRRGLVLMRGHSSRLPPSRLCLDAPWWRARGGYTTPAPSKSLQRAEPQNECMDIIYSRSTLDSRKSCVRVCSAVGDERLSIHRAPERVPIPLQSIQIHNSCHIPFITFTQLLPALHTRSFVLLHLPPHRQL